MGVLCQCHHRAKRHFFLRTKSVLHVSHSVDGLVHIQMRVSKHMYDALHLSYLDIQFGTADDKRQTGLHELGRDRRETLEAREKVRVSDHWCIVRLHAHQLERVAHKVKECVQQTARVRSVLACTAQRRAHRLDTAFRSLRAIGVQLVVRAPISAGQ